MAATVTGVFRIIDRASPAMRGMERQALKTDAAIASVGASLDGMGTQKRLSGIGKAQRDLRTLGVEAENVERRSRRAEGGLGRMERQAVKGGRAFRGMGEALRFSMRFLKPTIFLALGSAVGVLVQGVGALSGGLISLLPRMSDWVGLLAPATAGITGLALTLVSTKLAFNGLSQAMQGNKKALAALTPEGRRFLAHLKQYRPVLQELRRASQQGLFPGLDRALVRLQRGVPTLRGLLGAQGRRTGNLAAQAASQLTTDQALRDFQQIGNQGGRLFTAGGGILLDFVAILRNFAVSARPFTDWLSSSLTMWSRHRREVSLFNRDSGKTAAFLDRSRVALTNLWHIAENLWGTFRNIGRAARPLGDDLWRSAERTTASWEKATRSNEKLTRDFLAMRPAIHEINAIIGGLARGIFRMGTDPGLPKTLQGIRAMGASLERILTFLANDFGPVFAHLLGTIGDTLTTLTGVTGPFRLMLELLDKTLQVVNGLSRAVPGLGSVFTVALDVFLIQRFLVKLGLMRAGWLGVAAAADTAAAAEARASAAGLFGGMGGLFSRAGRGMVNRSLERNGLLAAALTSPRLGRLSGGLRMLGGGALRGGIGALIAAPLAQGIVGSAAGPRAGHLAGTTATGIALGAGIGSVVPGLGTLAGGAIGGAAALGFGLFRGGGGPSRAEQVQRQMTAQLATVQNDPNQLHRLTSELAIYQAAQRRLANDRSQAAQQELQQIQYEVQARQSVVSQLRAEQQQRMRAKAAARVTGIERDLTNLFGMLRAHGQTPLGAVQRINRIAYAQIERTNDPAARMRFARDLLKWERGVLGVNDPQFRRTRGRLSQLVPGLLPATSPGFRATGSWKEQLRILDQMNPAAGKGGATEAYRQFLSRAPTRLQEALIANLVVAGIPGGRAAALAHVMSADATGHAPIAMAPSSPASQNTLYTHPADRHGVFTRPFRVGRAAGGRIPGMGLSDTVAIGPGAMAAPGELIVNRHQERAADSRMGGKGALAQIVHGIRTSHRENYATGGRFGGATILNQGWYNRTVALGRRLAGMGYAVGENPAFGGVHPVHVPNSYHYIGQALDVNADNMPGGEMKNLDRLWRMLHKSVGALGLSQLIWRAKGHWDHLHVALGAGVGGRGSYFPTPFGLGGGGGGVPGIALGNAAAAVFPGAFGGGGGGGGGLAGAAGEMIGQGAVFGGAARGLAGMRSLIGLPLSAYSGGGGGARGVATATRAASPAAAAGRGGTSTQNMALGQRMMLGHGWGASEWPALRSLWNRESSWRTTARNPSSGAYGIPQSLPASKLASAGPDWQTNPATQIKWGLDYIAGRYGSPSAAWNAWQSRSPHWYQGGGRVKWGGWFGRGGSITASQPTMVGIGERGKETATVTRGGGPGLPPSLTVHVGGISVSVGSGEDVSGSVHEQVLAGVESALEEFAREMSRTNMEPGGE